MTPAACALPSPSAMAVATGTAEVVVCYRALNERSGHRFGRVATGLAGNLTTAGIDNGWHYPMGLATPAAMVAMIARRYMHVSGATSEDFGVVTVADRTRSPGRSPSRSGCLTAARRAMAPWPWWSRAWTARATGRAGRP